MPGMNVTELLNLENADISEWFELREGVEVHLKYVHALEITKLLKKATKRVFKNHQSADEVDSVKYNQLVGREAVLGWKGFVVTDEETGNEVPLEFNQGSIDSMMRYCNEFATFVHDTTSEYQRFVDARKEELVEEAEKN